MSFEDLGLDIRLIRGISKFGWKKPTEVQLQCIPKVINGYDVVVKSMTGSGKSAVYIIPIINEVLKEKSLLSTISNSSSTSVLKYIIFAPSKELSNQINQMFINLSDYCTREIKSLDISQFTVEEAATMFNSPIDILITTPGRLDDLIANNKHDSENKINIVPYLSNVKMIVIDEADLVGLYEHGRALTKILNILINNQVDNKEMIGNKKKKYKKSSNSKKLQIILLSATLDENIQCLVDRFLTEPFIFKDNQQNKFLVSNQLKQYFISFEKPEDKWVIMTCLIALKLIVGRILIFVSSPFDAYKISLILNRFQKSTCVVDHRLPLNSRMYIIEKFNQGAYECIVASDQKSSNEHFSYNHSNNNNGNNYRFKREPVANYLPHPDTEFNLSRGMDFTSIDVVINFDLPSEINEYIHRIGRTARMDKSGTALSFAQTDETNLIQQINQKLMNNDCNSSSVDVNSSSDIVKPYKFRMDIIEKLRYRINDVFYWASKQRIRDYERSIFKKEILSSEVLKKSLKPEELRLLNSEFNRNPNLKGDKTTSILPDYLIPFQLKSVVNRKTNEEKERMYNDQSNSYAEINSEINNDLMTASSKKQRKRSNPLKDFNL